MSTAPPALYRLLHEVIDYAGLFPPAGLSMPEAVVNFAAYRTSAHAWMLARFITPAARLPEFAEAVAGLRSHPRVFWRVSAVAGEDAAAAAREIETFNARDPAFMRVDTVELRAAAPRDVEPVVKRFRERLQVFVELPLTEAPAGFLEAIRGAGALAKARTGGITADAFPASADLARFIRACTSAGIAFKATAGLHHAIRSEHRLTYELGAPHGVMFGFLNVLVATGLAHTGAGNDELQAVLEERDRSAFSFTDVIRWRDRSLSDADVRQTRASLRSFGSCSFTEPVKDLAALALV